MRVNNRQNERRNRMNDKAITFDVTLGNTSPGLIKRLEQYNKFLKGMVK